MERMTDKEIRTIDLEKYIEALNNILGADNAYFRGDKDVDAIVELIGIANRQQAEIEDVRIAAKSFKSKYLNAVKTAKELKTVIKEKESEIKRLNAKVKSVYEELHRIALMTVETDRNGV